MKYSLAAGATNTILRNEDIIPVLKLLLDGKKHSFKEFREIDPDVKRGILTRLVNYKSIRYEKTEEGSFYWIEPDIIPHMEGVIC